MLKADKWWEVVTLHKDGNLEIKIRRKTLFGGGGYEMYFTRAPESKIWYHKGSSLRTHDSMQQLLNDAVEEHFKLAEGVAHTAPRRTVDPFAISETDPRHYSNCECSRCDI